MTHLPQSCGHLVTCSSKSLHPQLTEGSNLSGRFALVSGILTEAQILGWHPFPGLGHCGPSRGPVVGSGGSGLPAHGGQKEKMEKTS